jgi:diketogulonate reductase-like aldo/keto reductase
VITMSELKEVFKDVTFPPLLYGTAWKEERTHELTLLALQNGFEGIDTANQRKHYFEEGVGNGIQQFLKESGKKRHDLFLQTKFTSSSGQDHRMPYDESDPIPIQVQKSFESSLKHLHTDYIDSFILHGPTFSSGLTKIDLEIWVTMERLYREGKTKLIGISNVNLEQLETLYKESHIKPAFVQNRCFADTQWDLSIRQFCQQHRIIYQGFSLLTANVPYLSTPVMQIIARKYKKSIPQIIFRFALQCAMLPLTGTTSLKHMQEDLALSSFELSADELKNIENISLLEP